MGKNPQLNRSFADKIKKQQYQKYKYLINKILLLVVALVVLTGITVVCFIIGRKKNIKRFERQYSPTADHYRVAIDIDGIPNYSGSPYCEINNNNPFFDLEEVELNAEFETYSKLDELGRCGTAFANLCMNLMPSEERGAIGMVRPTGWHTVKYPGCIEDLYLYNRCHLIAYSLAGENSNELNLITGTRYMNVEGMLPFENMVRAYIVKTENHVLYRVTPIFKADELLARGIVLEAKSIEDDGMGICFNVFIYNVQPGIVIDYSDGDSWELNL